MTDDSPADDGASREADDRLIDALLVHLHDARAADRREARVARVMAALQAGSRRRPARIRWIRVGWAAAAAAVVTAGVLLFTATETPALASLEDIVAALSTPGDRAFALHVADDQPPADGGRPGLDGALLYLRDGEQFLLVRVGRNGKRVLDGFDGRISWRIRGGVVVEETEGPGAGRVPVPQFMAEMPLLDLPGTLEALRRDYTVEPLDLSGLPEGGPPLRHLLARKKPRQAPGPTAIEIWADPATGMPRRIVFEGAKFQGSPRPRHLTFDLVSQDPLPEGWFHPSAHLPPRPGRPAGARVGPPA